MLWRRLLTPIVCLLMVHAAFFVTPVLVSPAQAAPPPGVALDASGTPQNEYEEDYKTPLPTSVGISGLGAVGSDNMAKILEKRANAAKIADPGRADDYAKALEKDLKSVKNLDTIAHGLGILAIGLETVPGAIRAWDAASSGDWREAAVQAAGVIEIVGKGILKTAAGEWAGGAAAAWSYGLCLALAVAAPVCIGAMVLTHVLVDYAVGELIDATLEPFEAPFCRKRRTDNGACEPSPLYAPDAGAGPGGSGPGAVGGGSGAAPGAPSTGAPGTGRYAGKGPPPQPGFAGGGGVRVGSTTTTVTAKNLTASATGAGSSAVNNIGSIASGGGRASVAVQSITTTASGGQDATTNIGTSGGDTVVTGNTYNEGGDLTIGSAGTSRDGRKCIDVYRNTCIVYIYYRKHYSEPCLPGYWRVLNACKLPSDDKHSIPGL